MYAIIADIYGEKINKKLIFFFIIYIQKMEKQTYYKYTKI